MTESSVLTPPAVGEYLEYYHKYIDRVPQGDLLETLERQYDEVPRFLGEIPAGLHEHRYAEGKWSVKEVVGHLSDTERIFGYRALRVARGDETPLPGYDENAFVANAGFDRRPLQSLVDEWRDVRRATLALLRAIDATEAARSGVANGAPISVRAIAYIIAGHTEHHLEILKTRYLAGS